MKTTIAILGGALALSACGQPMAPSFTSADVTAFDSQAATFAGLADSSPTLPSGSASYTGLIGATLAGEPGGLIGNITLDANFDSGDISGQIANMNILDVPDITDQEMGGSIDLAGSISGSGLTATGSGTFTAVADGATIRLVTDATINGQFKDNTATHDVIVGSMDLSGTIELPFGGGSEAFSATSGGTDFYLTQD